MGQARQTEYAEVPHDAYRFPELGSRHDSSAERDQPRSVQLLPIGLIERPQRRPAAPRLGDHVLQEIGLDGGSASAMRQLLDAGLVDELRVDVMPVILGGGLRFLDDVDPEWVALEKLGVDNVGPRTSLRFHVTTAESSAVTNSRQPTA
jgi:riboflavin biosynthesis pyrimidine reductase